MRAKKCICSTDMELKEKNTLAVIRSVFKITCVLFVTTIGIGFSQVYGQTPILSWGAWNMQSVDGSINLEGQYRQQETVLRSNLTERPQASLFSGQFILNTKSYIWHPNFMLLDLNLDFSPGTQRERLLLAPDRSEVRTAERMHARSTFFNERPFSASLFTNFSHGYIARENTSNVETIRKDFGANFRYPNKVAPLMLNYKFENWTQNESQTNRKFVTHRHNLNSIFSKSFNKLNKHQLTFSFDDYLRDYSFNARTRSKISRVDLKSDMYLDKNQDNSFNSLFMYYYQKGDFNFKRFQANEAIKFKLPKNFLVSGNYQYNYFNQTELNSNQHVLRNNLNHKIFLSIDTDVYLEYTNLKQSTFSELTKTAGLSFVYRKKIPTGRVAFSYAYRNRNENRDNESAFLNILNEEHVLDDLQVVLLNNPFINLNSIVVTDETKTLFYQENIDYILIQRGEFVEIQRLPGGFIASYTKVFIDYTSTQQVSYKLSFDNHRFTTTIGLFNQFLELYFRTNELDYNNVETVDLRILKTISQRVYGTRFSLGILRGGWEKDIFNSNIIPSRSIRYHVTLAGNLFNRLGLSLAGNLRDYLLVNDNEKQKLTNISGKLIYRLNKRAKVNFEGGYRLQEGRGIDLALTTFRGELTSLFHQLLLTVGFEKYKRNFLEDRTNFNRIYLKIQRIF